MLYEQIEALTRERGSERIFAPVAYRVVRETQYVPVVHVEAMSLAAWFPLCWRLDEDNVERFVALRTLLDGGDGQPAGSPQQVASLPLALRAYPFAVIQDDNGVGDIPARIDAPVADQPTDVGAPILTPDGRPGVGAKLRLHAVTAFNAALPATQVMTADLKSRDLLVPWPLRFDLGARSVAIEDLKVVQPDAYGSANVRQFVKAFGTAGAMLLAGHRLSLFRAGVLLERAKACIKAAAPAAVSPSLV